MVEYNRYPAMDENNNFPPAVREALSRSEEIAGSIKTSVGPLVSEALGRDSLPASAAASAAVEAVGREVTSRGLVNSSDPRLPNYSDEQNESVFSVTDQEDRRSWIETDKKGRPTAHSTSLILEKISAPILKAVTDGIYTPGEIKNTEASGVAFAITDSDGGRSWIESDLRGRPTEHSAKLIAEGLTLEESVGKNSTPVEVGSRLVDSAVNKNGKWQIRSHDVNNGKTTVLSPDGDAIDPRPFSKNRVGYLHRKDADSKWSSVVTPVDGGLTNKIIPDSIVCWGDSLTFANNGTWAKELATLVKMPAISRGVSGERAEAVAARQGGIKRLLTVAGGVIPATGSVSVTADGVFLRPNQYQVAGTMDGTLAGVAGTITSPTEGSSTYFFNRKTDGKAVTVSSPVPWISDDSITYRDNLQIYWVGRNNYPYDFDGADGDVAAMSIDAMISNIQSVSKRFVVMPVLNGKDEGIGSKNYEFVKAFDDYAAAKYADNFVPIRRILIDRGLEIMGITPTAQDLLDVAADTVPASLRVDYIHLSGGVYTKIIAKSIADFIISKGWDNT